MKMSSLARTVDGKSNTGCDDHDSYLRDVRAGASNRREEWFTAVKSNNTSQVKCLVVGHGLNLNALDEIGWSGLHTAAWNGYDEVCQVLLTAGCDPDVVGQHGSTPLTLASQKGHVDVVRRLISSGCSVQKLADLGDCSGVSPLHLAAQYGHRDVVQVLIKAGACVSATMSVRGISGITPLHLAVEAGHLDVMEVLLEAGVDVNTTTRPATESTA